MVTIMSLLEHDAAVLARVWRLSTKATRCVFPASLNGQAEAVQVKPLRKTFAVTIALGVPTTGGGGFGIAEHVRRADVLQQKNWAAHSFVVDSEAHLHAVVIAAVSLAVHAVGEGFAAVEHVLLSQQYFPTAHSFVVDVEAHWHAAAIAAASLSVHADAPVPPVDFAVVEHVLSSQQYDCTAHSFVVDAEAHLHAPVVVVIANVSLWGHAFVDVGGV
jgi:hypothetical protein